jgi:MFS transporter, FSR family, fosmidomycin resistance protein
MEPLEKKDKLAIFSLSAGHFINDAYSNFLGPLLPLLMAKLKLTIAEAGWLVAILVFSSSFTQPIYGYFSDRYLKRAFAVFSPLVTAVFMSCIGLAPNYLTLATLLLCAGIGIASFHPQSAAMTALASRHRKGLGLSIFVTSGTLGFALGPLIITYAVAFLGMERSYLVMIPGLLAFGLLFFFVPRMEHSTKTRGEIRLRHSLKIVWQPLLLLYMLAVIRTAVQMCFVNFLPLYFSQKGFNTVFGGKMTALFLFFGAIGGFSGGTLADKFGERNVISFSMLLSAPFLVTFLLIQGILSYIVLAIGGIILLSTLPVNVVMAQSLLPSSASTVSALMMGLAWGMGGMIVPLVGKIADLAGLSKALIIVVLLPIAGFVLSLGLPARRAPEEAIQIPAFIER